MDSGKTNILYIHHGNHRAGAPLSLLYTIVEVRKQGYNPIVGLAVPSPELNKLYLDHGIKTIEMPWIKMLYFWSANRMEWWKPSTYKALWNILIHQRKGLKRTQACIDTLSIQIVHLNSVSLVALVPYLLKRRIKFVWHIREHGPEYKSLLRYYVRKLMLRSPDVIFLSKAEQYSWIGSYRHGKVMYNFVDKAKFDYSIDTDELRKKLGLNGENQIILYAGGAKYHKGITILIEALKILAPHHPTIRCIMLDFEFPNKNKTNLSNLKRNVSKFYNSRYIDIEKFANDQIKAYNLDEICIRLPFDAEAQPYYALADLVVFPATCPHFARPVIEAAMMKKPVVVTDWPILREIILNGKTGLTSKPKDSVDLADKMATIIFNKKLGQEMGEDAYAFAMREFTPENQMPVLLKMYSALSERKYCYG